MIRKQNSYISQKIFELTTYILIRIYFFLLRKDDLAIQKLVSRHERDSTRKL